MQEPEQSIFHPVVIQQPRFALAQMPEEPRQLKDELLELWWAFWSRKLLIVGIVCVFAVMCLVYLRLATPLYSARAEVFIDPL
ncbi:MAG: Wzz/FepE/Etk N-terminal domain-containing protein, partial [Hyphomicrobiales bacterium]